MSYGSVHELITKARYRAYLLSLTRARQRLHPPRHPATAAMKSAITILSLQLLINFNSKSAIKTWRSWGIVLRINLRTIEVSVRFTLWPHYPRGKNSCTHFVEGWGWIPESMWTLRTKNLFACRKSIPNSTVDQAATYL